MSVHPPRYTTTLFDAIQQAKQRPLLLRTLIAFAIVSDIALFVLVLTYGGEYASDAIILFPLPWLPLLWWIKKLTDVARVQLWRNLARRHGWEYRGIGVFNREGPLFLNHRHGSRKVHNVVAGVYKSIPLQVFEVECTTRTGKQQKYPITCFSFTFPGRVPHLYLNYKSGIHATVPLHASKLVFPNKFSDTFDLYVPREYEIEAFEVFTPDILEAILRCGFVCDIECLDNQLIVIREGYVLSEATFEQELGRLYEVIEDLIDTLKRVHFVAHPALTHGLVEHKSTWPYRYFTPQNVLSLALLAIVGSVIMFMVPAITIDGNRKLILVELDGAADHAMDYARWSGGSFEGVCELEQMHYALRMSCGYYGYECVCNDTKDSFAAAIMLGKNRGYCIDGADLMKNTRTWDPSARIHEITTPLESSSVCPPSKYMYQRLYRLGEFERVRHAK